MTRAALVLLGLLVAFPAAADPRYISTGTTANYPDGFPAFCDRNPAECLPYSGAATVKAAIWKDTLVKINNQVNKRIRFVKEHGERDDWRMNVSAGDCEDYVLTKRARLIGIGLPRSAMRIGYVDSKETGLHAVLVVSTDDGDRVLDNMTNWISTPNRTDYRWISVQDRKNPRRWLSVR